MVALKGAMSEASPFRFVLKIHETAIGSIMGRI
jgi:hypothetical protein